MDRKLLYLSYIPPVNWIIMHVNNHSVTFAMKISDNIVKAASEQQYKKKIQLWPVLEVHTCNIFGSKSPSASMREDVKGHPEEKASHGL